MSIPIPLTVRLSTIRGSKSVSRELRDLTFRSVAPGGFASAAISLDRPLTLQPNEIGYYGKLYIYDARNGRTVWEGRVEDPGRGVDDSGQVWQVAAIGPSGHVHDRTVPLVYIDTSLTSCKRVENTKPGFVTEAGTVPFNDPLQGLVSRLPQGLTVTLGDLAAQRYGVLSDALTGQKLAHIKYDAYSGGPNTDWVLEGVCRTDGSLASGDIADSLTMTAAIGGVARTCTVVSDFTNGRNTIDFRFRQTSGGTVTALNDLHWVAFANLVIRTMLKDSSGTDITTGYTNNYVLAHEVVRDLLGRLLTSFDGANAAIATNTFHIEVLAYPNAVDAGKVLDDLMTLEPSCYWAAWESNTAGKHRFEWITWPTTVRYEASTRDGYSSQGSADGLFNAVRVRYLDESGRTRTVQRTRTVAELTAAGLTREWFIDLGTETGTSANANQIGDEFLADHSTAPNAGTLKVSRPVLDRALGRMVQPWEIRPGTLIRVRGIQPRVDSLNATTRDGTSVFRIVGVTYHAASAAAELELDSYPPTVARALANIQRANTARR